MGTVARAPTSATTAAGTFPTLTVGFRSPHSLQREANVSPQTTYADLRMAGAPVIG
jgi:hypothetical protein